MHYTSIYSDGKNNFQINFHGSLSTAISNFKEFMIKNGAKWARMFSAATGDPVAAYLDNNVAYQKHFEGKAQKIKLDGQPQMAVWTDGVLISNDEAEWASFRFSEGQHYRITVEAIGDKELCTHSKLERPT